MKGCFSWLLSKAFVEPEPLELDAVDQFRRRRPIANATNGKTVRPEIRKLFECYKRPDQSIIDVNGLLNFLSTEQKEILSVDDCRRLIERLHAEIPSKLVNCRRDVLSLDGFEHFLLSADQSILDPEHSNVCQDMTRPLNDYFIASSHNTYLLAGQLLGPSSTEGYIMALESGCRCVELDIWPPRLGTNLKITHGLTMTTKVNLEPVLEAIRDHAFVNNKYPVILSIENHCGLEDQKRIAIIFKEIFGDLLCTDFLDDGELRSLPSPEQLTYKILVKFKKLPPSTNADQAAAAVDDPLVDNDENRVSDRDDESDLDETSEEDASDEDENDDPRLSHNSGSSSNSSSPAKVAQAFSDIVIYCVACRFTSFEDALMWQPNQMCSFSELRALHHLESNVKDFFELTKGHLCRIYPKGTRTSSSNFDPIPLFNIGCQMVALNYQTKDMCMFHNSAQFQLNGNCGYVLKPDILTRGFNFEQPEPELMRKYTITIISGQNIPTAEGSRVVNPYVVVQISGHPSDYRSASTLFVDNNGLNPRWNEKFEFIVNVPDIAFLLFTVKDDSVTGKNVDVAKYALPLRAARTGFRHVHLRDSKFDLIPSASLFVHIAVSEVTQKLPKKRKKYFLCA